MMKHNFHTGILAQATKGVFAMKLAFVSAFLLAYPAHAETSTKDIQVGARAVAFSSLSLSGSVKVAVVYRAGSAASKEDADKIAAAFGSGVKSGKANLEADVVSEADLAASQYPVIILAADTSEVYGAISSKLSGTSAISISTDIDCVSAGLCVVGIRTSPKVEIYVSASAAESSGVSFSNGFLMMVTEL